MSQAITTRPTTAANPISAMLLDPEWQNLPYEVRMRVRKWASLFAGVSRPGVTAQLTLIGEKMDRSYANVRARYSAWQKTGDWRVLADGRSVPNDLTKDPGFVLHWGKLVEENQRSTREARRALIYQWKAREVIPGYEDFEGWPEIPHGWSETNLARIKPPKADLSLMRFGIKASAKYLPQTLRTRVGTWPGSHIQMDDVWHDEGVRHGSQACRVLEFGALDVWSGCRYAWGTKPRRKTEAGKWETLSEKDFRFFVASTLWNHGYSARGTVLMLERGTAALREAVAQPLFDATGGLISVETGGMHGETQALLGLWGGRAGGKGNFKSHLESLHNLMHNAMAALPGQFGKDRQSQKESTYGLVKYQEALLKWAAELPADLAAHLQHPLLDYHTQFVPLLNHIYGVAINGRTDHDLEGWAELGRIVTRYTLAPGSGLWLDIDDIPEETRALIMSAAAADPARWTHRHRMSPAEVLRSGREELIKPSLSVIIDLIGPDCAEPRRVEGSYIEFQDMEISPSPLIYEARVLTPEGQEKELKRGETYLCFAFPYDPSVLAVCDAKLRCLGTARRVKRVSLADKEGMIDVWSRNATRTSEILEGVRARHAGAEQDAEALRRHNAALGFPGVAGRNGGRKEAKKAREKKEKRQAAVVADFLGHESRATGLDDDWLEGGSASPYR